MSCTCDYDPPAFVNVEERKARKQHTCTECGHVILPGEQYEHVRGMWDGDISSFDTCMPCVDLRGSVAEFNGGCFAYGELSEAYREYLENNVITDQYHGDICNAVMNKHKNMTTNVARTGQH